jgi:hypothetical protein
MAATVRIASMAPKGDGPPASGPLVDDIIERDRVVGYLESGTAILSTTATAPDRYDPTRPQRAGLSVRSDGVWVWSDAITFYAKEYGVPVEPELHEHIRSRGYRCPRLDDAAAAAALGAFAAVRRDA